MEGPSSPEQDMASIALAQQLSHNNLLHSLQHTKFGWNICLRSKVLSVQTVFFYWYNTTGLLCPSWERWNPSLVTIAQMVAELRSHVSFAASLPPLIGSTEQTVLKMENPSYTFLKLGLKIICAKFCKHRTKFGACKRFYTFPLNPKWRPRQFGCYEILSMVKLDISQDINRQRNYFIKVNTSTVISQNTFMLPATPPFSHMTPFLEDILRIKFRVSVPTLVSLPQRTAEISLHFLFSGLSAEFDWLYRTNGFENQISFDNFCEAWSEDHIW